VVRRAHTCEQRSKACSPPFPLEQDKIRENVCVTEGKKGGWRALLSFGSLTSSWFLFVSSSRFVQRDHGDWLAWPHWSCGELHLLVHLALTFLPRHSALSFEWETASGSTEFPFFYLHISVFFLSFWGNVKWSQLKLLDPSRKLWPLSDLLLLCGICDLQRHHARLRLHG
jgi:hypothetical protein